MVEEDRGLAIQFAIANALPGDCVLIAGKGHEDHQLIVISGFPSATSRKRDWRWRLELMQPEVMPDDICTSTV